MNLSLMTANEGRQRRDNRYNKSDDLLSELQTFYVKSVAVVDSWYGRVLVVRSRMFNVDSWRWSSRGDTARYLSVES